MRYLVLAAIGAASLLATLAVFVADALTHFPEGLDR